ncbi:hypothetical protein [Pediococcus pentosaceus]|uniref:hypothetical protein n=1 Tax=Pediococcus pentosaceus TaxID=1255 RepID=UPI003982616E
MKTLKFTFFCHEGTKDLRQKELKLEGVKEDLPTEIVKQAALQLSRCEWLVDGQGRPRWKKVRRLNASYINTETLPLVDANLD